MAIKPFEDRGIVDLGKNVNKYTIGSQTGSSATQTTVLDRLRQGVSIRSVSQQYNIGFVDYMQPCQVT